MERLHHRAPPRRPRGRFLPPHAGRPTGSRAHVGLTLALALTVVATARAQEPGASGPWRVGHALGLPDWLSVRGEQRTRYESLDNQFRALRRGSDQIFAYRTLLELKVDTGPFEVVVEGIDARQSLADSGTPINTTIVDTLDLLQAYAAVRFDGVFAGDDELKILVGRHTMDIGSRRFVARNRYRNTINAFTGVNALWTGAGGETVRAFWTMPVRRLPNRRQKLLDNEHAFDEEYLDIQFWGLYASIPEVLGRTTAEFGVLGLFERDSAEVLTRRRELVTVTGRLVAKPTPGHFDFEFEAAEQIGDSLEFNPLPNLPQRANHRASFQHIEVGRTFDVAWRPRVALQFDNATGDRTPNDGDNERFDTLFGARRFEFGPTGIYGAFARSNLTSPGYRVTAKPTDRVQLMFAHRWYWLNSDTDAWTTAGVRDPAGNSGSYLGTQAEVRVRYDIWPGNLRVEGGALYFNKGSFVDNAPNSNGEGDSTYGYVQTVLTF